MLLLALSTVFVFGGDRGYFYRGGYHNWLSSHHLTIAVNLSPKHGFQRFHRRVMDENGAVRYTPYNRFPIGGYAAMKAATLPFGGSLSAQLYAARILMLLFFAGAAVLAYLSLCRLTSNRWIALTATLLSFSSLYFLYYNDVTANEMMPDFFGVLLVFHGMVVFVQEGRFRQLLVKTCIALLLGWHVLALLAPFVIFGLASDLLRARSAAATPPSYYVKLKRAASALFRSRYLLLGITVLAFGLAVLTFNFTMEYAALDGETPLTELPSFKSMLKRTGAGGVGRADHIGWLPFLEGQFRIIPRMFIPYALLGTYVNESPMQLANEGPTQLSNSLAVALGVALSAACLIGSLFVRPRILFTTLASFGFFWALPMRHNTALHHFEVIYYIGLPLVFFTILLLLARKLTNRDDVIAAAAVASAALFAVSSFQMSGIDEYYAEVESVARSGEQDLLAMRELIAGETVVVHNIGDIRELFPTHAVSYTPIPSTLSYPPLLPTHAVSYYLNSAFVDFGYPSSAGHKFIVTRQRVSTDALLTPQNRYLFLYDMAGLTAWYRSTYGSVMSAEPLAREDFDVYLIDDTVYFLKEPCNRSNLDARIFLHVFPESTDDLPDGRRKYKFDNFVFAVGNRGLLFDDRCLASVGLPQYDIAGVRTGRLDGGNAAWSAAYVVQGPKLISEYQTIVSGEHAARSEFDLYIRGGKLYYVKEPCGRADTAASFFLHVVPEDENDLPDERKQHGFDDLNFGFDVRGVLFDGKCAAAVSLPQYGIARITTGQFNGDGRIWSAAHAIRGPKLISEYQAIVSNEPAARSEFDVYVAEGKLYYVKEPCGHVDTAARFFLHVVPEDENDLPDDRRQHGFDNLDFDFGEHGVLFDGKCMASVDLPGYGIARIVTGQFDDSGRVWEVDVAPVANE